MWSLFHDLERPDPDPPQIQGRLGDGRRARFPPGRVVLDQLPPLVVQHRPPPLLENVGDRRREHPPGLPLGLRLLIPLGRLVPNPLGGHHPRSPGVFRAPGAQVGRVPLAHRLGVAVVTPFADALAAPPGSRSNGLAGPGRLSHRSSPLPLWPPSRLPSSRVPAFPILLQGPERERLGHQPARHQLPVDGRVWIVRRSTTG